MNKTKMVLCFLLAVVLIFPLALAIAPAVRADPEAEKQAEATLTFGGTPYVVGIYQMKGKFTVYDWAHVIKWKSTGKDGSGSFARIRAICTRCMSTGGWWIQLENQL